MEERSEEGEKEEDLGADKEDHPYAYPPLDFAGVFPLKSCLSGDIPSPLNYCGEDKPEPRPHKTSVVLMRVGRQARYQAKPPDRAGKGSGSIVHNMKWVLGHCSRHKGVLYS